MPKRLHGTLGPLLLVLLSGRESTTAPHAVTDMRAYLYFQETGTIDSLNVIDGAPSRVHLWNTIIGEGSAGLPSAATMVLVNVTGQFLSRTPGSLRLIAKVGDRVLLRRDVPFETFFTERRSAWVPFIVYNTGCGALTLTASSLAANGSVESTLTKTIAFDCGE